LHEAFRRRAENPDEGLIFKKSADHTDIVKRLFLMRLNDHMNRGLGTISASYFFRQGSLPDVRPLPPRPLCLMVSNRYGKQAYILVKDLNNATFIQNGALLNA
jgi:hypothetical protein